MHNNVPIEIGSSNSITYLCGGVFRNHEANFICCFAENSDRGSAYHEEISIALRPNEIAHQNGWTNYWLVLDSALVVQAFKNSYTIPW